LAGLYRKVLVVHPTEQEDNAVSKVVIK
jgi:hypothetical protein